MRQTRSFLIAGIAALLLLVTASFGVAAGELMDSPAAGAAAVEAQVSTAESSGPNRLPLLIVGLGSLGAGAMLLRRAPALV